MHVSPHPTDKQLNHFAQGTLNDLEFEEIAGHIEQCDKCSAQIEERSGLLRMSNGTIMEGPGTVIGPYKLLQRIGEGGFGVVYMAEQTRPMQRRVALKVIKPGMDTKDVIARFEAERQALALMEHHNIAKVLDGGQTATGRPYFVMELVNGIPITEFCDANQLSPTQRLELFEEVCRAIQHAHQKGVIHRDIKPSNILVTLYDGKPVPKVIDFGVAKAMNQKLTERTLFTRFGQMIGTPQYMSPEQAEHSGMDVDTRSDIYSLGVLLYELMTGTTPLNPENLRSSGYAAMLRMVTEPEFDIPSTRLQMLGKSSQQIAQHRNTEPNQLKSFLRNELDWIVMKALERDRSRRYDSAGQLAADVNRFLHHDAVEAGPPSLAYKLRTFARRHRTSVVTACIVVMALLAATCVTTWQVIVTKRALGETKLAQTSAEASFEREAAARRIAAKEAIRADQNYRRAQDVIDQFLVQVSNQHEYLREAPGMMKLRLGLLEKALEYYRQMALERPDDLDVQLSWAAVTPQYTRCIKHLRGDYRTCRELLTNAIHRCEIVLQHDPENMRAKRVYGLICKQLSGLYGDHQYLEPAVSELEQYCGQQPNDIEAKMAWATLRNRLVERKNPDVLSPEVLAIGEETLAILRQYRHASPEEYSFALLYFGKRLADAGNEDVHLEYAQEAIEFLTPYAAERDCRNDIRFNLVEAYIHLFEAQSRRGGSIKERESTIESALHQAELLVKLNPSNQKHRRRLGNVHRLFAGLALEDGDPERALESWRIALDHFDQTPEYSRFLRALLQNVRAWFLATTHHDNLRDGALARRDAQSACSLTAWKNAMFVDTLAAACAACGDFENAVKHQKQAIELAGEEQNLEMVERLSLYEDGRAYQQPAGDSTSKLQKASGHE